MAEKKMDSTAAARIQGAEAKKNGGGVAKGGFAARAQRAAVKSTNGGGSKPSGKKK